MRDTTRLWILGAADPEMAAIEELLRECGEQIMYALDEQIRFGELTDGTLVLLWVEAEETWAVRLDELADWIHSSCSLVSYQPTGQ